MTKKTITAFIFVIGFFIGIGLYQKITADVVIATFAGGCFWCMQPPFQSIEGVNKVISGYAGGSGEAPTYENYAQKGYIEAVQISYDRRKVSYKKAT